MRAHRFVAASLSLAACGSEGWISDTARDRGSPDTADEDPVPPAKDETPPIALCAAEPNPARPGEQVTLRGENSYDEEGVPIINWIWNLEKSPEGSRARLVSNQANATFQPDVLGAYDATLMVTNQQGLLSNKCAVTVRHEPEQQLFVQLQAKYKNDDIHLALSRGTDWPSAAICSTLDCSGQDWGQAGARKDDPVALPTPDETLMAVAIAEPADGVYVIRAFDGPGGAVVADNPVTVTVYVAGRVVWTRTHTFKGEPAGADPTVALGRIAWNGPGRTTVEDL